MTTTIVTILSIFIIIMWVDHLFVQVANKIGGEVVHIRKAKVLSDESAAIHRMVSDYEILFRLEYGNPHRLTEEDKENRKRLRQINKVILVRFNIYAATMAIFEAPTPKEDDA